jgi:hypothetical protein
MRKILMVGAVAAVASVVVWLMRGWLVDLARLAARLSKTAAVPQHADLSHQPTSEAPMPESDMNANRVGSR